MSGRDADGADRAGSGSAGRRTTRWQAVRAAASPCFEWTAFSQAPAVLAEHRGQSLHYAPGRWLIGVPDGHIVAQLERAQAAGEGVLTEVSGKWLRIRIYGAARTDARDWPLAAAFARETLPEDRGCAALWIFDCPAIASLAGPDLDLWLEASYEASFLAMLESLGFAVP